ncbi:hypothetical protein C4D60_Mb05t08220 [Musa balbisiana]|uniref:LysM domain-containing protein n=1 Tax=Musa balbisiana TaxID=52838 RepID=A0A4S8JUL5_MUSBA|nr:hypothetical protein C4D60_Mb05t08220 [Musa balbisiana]
MEAVREGMISLVLTLESLDNGMEMQSCWDDHSDGLDLSLIVQEAETKLQNIESTLNIKSRAKMLEDAETEALIDEWGLNEKAFHCSPPDRRGGFGSPINLGRVSGLIVVPAEMGYGIMEILQRLASMGIEQLSRQASKLMPLEDITGKTSQRIAWDSATGFLHDLIEKSLCPRGLGASQNVHARREKSKGMTLASSSSGEMSSEYVSLEDMTAIAMNNIEAPINRGVEHTDMHNPLQTMSQLPRQCLLALIQVERVFVPPKRKIYRTVSAKGNSEQEDEVETESKPSAKEENHEEEVIRQFKITEVHVAGLRTESSKINVPGNPKQQQSGSRWLLATGIGKSNKHPLMKSKTIAKPSKEMSAKVQPGDTLWSISSRIHDSGAKRRELAALNPRIRNPDIIFPSTHSTC